ncbi:hypothetical protein Q8W71_29250 [Methylobacterium sp. NEAU 140]|uniref:hypothetical protein n=1 Tax=Methylobacterium sp. NEAU 140 TaxID=3064945 RepID=UPI00273758AA|nr:hypothetical protein [Methylobacterium sp. NEAU 140]MDP4026698.1 hypothetical protein [Methylobacterium sp. NEAU 140]
MRELIATVARGSPPSDLRGQGRLIERLIELEAEALATNAPRRTIEAIRAKRLQVRVSLTPRTSGLRGH